MLKPHNPEPLNPEPRTQELTPEASIKVEI